MVGLGDNVVISGLFAQDLAARLLRDHLNVLMIDVLASQLFAAVLIGGHSGHDGIGGQGVACFRGPGGNGGKQEERNQAELRHRDTREYVRKIRAEGSV